MQNGGNPQAGTTTIPEPSAPAPQPSSVGTVTATTPSLSSSLDLIGRSTATLVLLVYGLGFVILAFYDAQYGVAQFSPFRTRIILVGFVFVALVSLAGAAQHYGLAHLPAIEPIIKDTEPKRRAERDIVLAAAFIYTAVAISNSLGVFLFHDYITHIQIVHRPLWLTLTHLSIYMLGFTLFYLVAKLYLKKTRLATFLSVLAVAIMLGVLFQPGFTTPSTYLTLILFLAGWQTTWIKLEKNPLTYFLKYNNWYFILLILWFYISQVFNALPPRWGGGQPIPVQILQNTPAPWLGSNPADVLLLDETDQGLYVLLSPSGKAYFVPRGNVASMFFGTKDELKKP